MWILLTPLYPLILLISFCILSIFFRKSFIRIASMWCCNTCIRWKAIIIFSNIKKVREKTKYKSYLINSKVWVNGNWAWSLVYGQRINSHNTRKEHHNSCIHVGFKFKYLHWITMLLRYVATLYIVFRGVGVVSSYTGDSKSHQCVGASQKNSNCLFGNRVWFIHIKYACHSLIT